MEQDISSTVRYAGVDDTAAPLFENQYNLPKGMSYNSYVILDDEIAVMDSVEHGKAKQWMEQVEEATGGRAPRYLVAHHVEPDHSASVAEAMDRWSGLTVVGSAKALAMLQQFFPGRDFSGRTLAVREGSTLSLGSHTLTFYSAPMVHWPEVMVSYESSERLLFSADAFGKFGALCHESGDWAPEARRYYCNIVGKYGPQVRALLDKASKLEIDRILPLHGPVLGPDFGRELDLYRHWSSYEPEESGVLVAYSTIYGGTRDAALRLAALLREKGASVRDVELRPGDLSEAVAQAFRYSTIVVAAPTYDAGIFPPMYDFLHHLQIKGWRGRTAAVVENGSWAPTSGRLMADMLSQCRDIAFVEPRVCIRSRLDSASLAQLSDLAGALMKHLAQEVKKN